MAGYADIEPPPISPQQWSAENDGKEPPHEVYRAWRQWADRENAWIEKQAHFMGGQSTDEMLAAMGYKNEPDQGKSVYSRFKFGDRAGSLEQIGKDAFERAVGAGHFTLDPKTGYYYNIGHGDPNNPKTWQWVEPGTLKHKAPPGIYGYGGWENPWPGGKLPGQSGGQGSAQNPWRDAVAGALPPLPPGSGRASSGPGGQLPQGGGTASSGPGAPPPQAGPGGTPGTAQRGKWNSGGAGSEEEAGTMPYNTLMRGKKQNSNPNNYGIPKSRGF